ncbi:putative Rab-GTPase-TBC domain-containing protein [Lupinus albus]|uniref:Putative Rab-GTPase-TBC domain-containing protein n=1 Tax=Lupinus albus TaxID=3870 RepID=A0A6A4PFW8_LUPAL|nr:putative Rab-GTPase-TBC domain-containing protein [Lupinus albus]
MSCVEEEDKQWSCGKPATVNLQKVSSIMRDIGDPCVSQSPVKVNRMLKPDKWQAMFDSEGRAFGFRKALKLIVLGGVDPSIRFEVWEFLLGCYAPSSTAEYRKRLRTARREHYRDLIKQCQSMHSSVGTGSLAYVVGSKVMDVRTSSKNDHEMQNKIERSTSNDNNSEIGKCCERSITCTEAGNVGEQESSNDWFDIVSLRTSTDNATHDPFVQQNCSSPKYGRESDGSHYVDDSTFDFPPLPVTNLFEKSGKDENSEIENGDKHSAQHKQRFEDDRMHSFHIDNNADLVIESNDQHPLATFHGMDSEIEIASPNEDEPGFLSNNNPVYDVKMVNQLKISDASHPAMISSSISQELPAREDRVSEWLWTLHRIVVDVVRTDSHLEFYEDTRNLARMSDILAVYAWVDPATGYCQGMSDLLSPFVVIFEDNADAFWCFEMLLRRMRENFQMEGPIRVMKQLQELWHILEVSDGEMSAHLSKIGAESLHFAFRMLLVLFRRELSFNEALSMWEMMWASDFDESLAYDLEDKCLEALALHLSIDSSNDMREEIATTDEGSVKSSSQSNHKENDSTKASLQSNHANTNHSVYDVKFKSLSSHAFCGLARNIFQKIDRVQMRTISSLTSKGNDELSIFCVAAILVLNRQKIIQETKSFDDMIKMFNDNMLKIKVKRCITTAIKLRKKYFSKVIKKKKHVAKKGD